MKQIIIGIVFLFVCAFIGWYIGKSTLPAWLTDRPQAVDDEAATNHRRNGEL